MYDNNFLQFLSVNLYIISTTTNVTNVTSRYNKSGKYYPYTTAPVKNVIVFISSKM